MKELKHIFDNNRKWAESRLQQDPDFFQRLSLQQTPKYLWIGCSDSRIPANQVAQRDDIPVVPVPPIPRASSQPLRPPTGPVVPAGATHILLPRPHPDKRASIACTAWRHDKKGDRSCSSA